MTSLCSSPDTVITDTDHYYVHEAYKTGILPVHGVFPIVDVSGLHLSGFYYHLPYLVCTLYLDWQFPLWLLVATPGTLAPI